MPLLLQRLVAAVAAAAPLRRYLCTAVPRPPWAMVNSQAALDASGAPSQSARALVDLNSTPCVSHLSVPARLVAPHGDDMGSLVGIVRGASCDGLLLLDFIDARHRPLWPHEFAAARGGVEPEGELFVCNPLSGQLVRLPAPGMDVPKMGSTSFGLLTQSQGSHGPPDRYAVAQLSKSSRGGGECRRVVRRFLSETGEWDERPLVGVAEMDTARSMLINHEVLAFGDRLWWVDVAWGACSVDPFSDRPERRFAELPRSSVLPVSDSPTLSRYRRMGVSDGKLRYVQVSHGHKHDKWCVILSFSLDDETYSWALDQGVEITGRHDPCYVQIAAIDPFNADLVYLQHGSAVIAMDLAEGEEIWRGYLAKEFAFQKLLHCSLLVPCVLPTWLATSHIPSAGTLSSNKADCKRKSLADMLVRVDKC
ncbi:hypothetical protein CFC21_003013 [Triticum aestivum]|uniref:F-box protein At3g26010-like beta-propeller domain-containing protein n=1 Tax=Triticum aestivum TaxID=4565 RepID=A0A3B5Y3A4_WHEAT|nr:uncharacterized protein LOC123154943 [Triticum aestivum]KAF6985116.1 hypothetical protein CFC21_003013 [Triticum aestivum]